MAATCEDPSAVDGVVGEGSNAVFNEAKSCMSDISMREAAALGSYPFQVPSFFNFQCGIPNGAPTAMTFQDMVVQASNGVLKHGSIIAGGNGSGGNNVGVSSKEDDYCSWHSGTSGCAADSFNSYQFDPTSMTEQQVPSSALCTVNGGDIANGGVIDKRNVPEAEAMEGCSSENGCADSTTLNPEDGAQPWQKQKRNLDNSVNSQ